MTNTIEQFVTEKKSNFAALLSKMFEDCHSSGGAIQDQIATIRDMGAGDFLIYCRAYVLPHRATQFDTFIGELCALHSQDLSKFDPADVAKCRRYLELFCSVA